MSRTSEIHASYEALNALRCLGCWRAAVRDVGSHHVLCTCRDCNAYAEYAAAKRAVDELADRLHAEASDA